MRFDFIEQLCEQTVVKPRESREQLRSEASTGCSPENTRRSPVLGIMVLVFYLTFGVIGAWLQDLLETGHRRSDAAGGHWPDGVEVNPAVHSAW